MTPVSKDIEKVVEDMREVPNGPPYYFAGHQLTIGNLLVKRDMNNAEAKFPFVALRLGTKYTIKDGLAHYSLNILLATDTKKAIRETTRIDDKFIPILYPMYNDFFKSLRKSGLFKWVGNQKIPDHEAVERYFIGMHDGDKNVKATFNEPIDAIEILNLKITSTKYC